MFHITILPSIIGYHIIGTSEDESFEEEALDTSTTSLPSHVKSTQDHSRIGIGLNDAVKDAGEKPLNFTLKEDKDPKNVVKIDTTLKEANDKTQSMDISFFQMQQSGMDASDSEPKRHLLINPDMNAQKCFVPIKLKTFNKAEVHLNSKQQSVAVNDDDKDKGHIISSPKSSRPIVEPIKKIKNVKGIHTDNASINVVPDKQKMNKNGKPSDHDICESIESKLRSTEPSNRIKEKDKTTLNSNIKCDTNDQTLINVNAKTPDNVKLRGGDKQSNRDRTESCSSYGSLLAGASEYDAAVIAAELKELKANEPKPKYWNNVPKSENGVGINPLQEMKQMRQEQKAHQV